MLTLGAPFGAGKTTFLRMWQADLECRRLGDSTVLRPIVLNAWESDFCGDPLIAIVTGLIESVESRGQESSSQDTSKLREAAKDAAWFATGLANSVVSHLTGADAIAAGEFATRKQEERKARIPDVIRLYQERLGSLRTLKELLQKQFGDSTGGAIIMIDELDRCRPDYAISYLETIKHVFDLPGLVFVLAVDYQRLASAAEHVFGKLDFAEYYRKFVHRTVHLPIPENESLSMLAQLYVPAFLEKKSVRASLLNINSHTIHQIVELIAGFRLTPRQTQEVFRVIGHVLSGNDERRGQLLWCIGVGTILMSVLRVGEREIYERLGAGKLPHIEFGQLLIDRLGKDAKWWFSIYITGAARSEIGDVIDLESLYKKLNFVKEGEKFDPRERLGQFSQGWGHGEGRLLQIFSKIEQIASF